MRKIALLFILIFFSFISFSQDIPRPKLVVGIVVDQMRWDYLYRFYERYAENGGFKRMLKQGFSCENTFIPYTPTVTACGHASISTGSVPAIHGIISNYWYDAELNKDVYCTGDIAVKGVGTSNESGLHSPANLLSTTIGDELRLATNFRGKVIGIAIKDRGSILSAGHSANAAYWYDNKTGNWISSSHYVNELPQWVNSFNTQKLVDKYYQQGWSTLYPLNTYVQSTADENRFENKPFGAEAKGFPYNFNRFVGVNYSVVPAMPAGNTFTAEFAKAAIINEQLGADAITDLLALSFSTPDYIGHSFGPNSVEVEDGFLRLDKDLGDLLDFLDSKIGKGQYLAFLSSDHGVASVPGFLMQNKIKAGNTDTWKLADELNPILKNKFRKDDLITTITNQQVYLDIANIDGSKLQEVKDFIINYISKQQGIDRVFDLQNMANANLNSTIKERFVNGYHFSRSGQLQIVHEPHWLDGYKSGGSGHSAWNPYDAHIPLLWYGWGIKPGATNREVYMTDIAATLAAMLHIQMPDGCVGKVITEVMAR